MASAAAGRQRREGERRPGGAVSTCPPWLCRGGAGGGGSGKGRGLRAEGRPTNGDARKDGGAHINIINTSRHPAIRPRLPLFYSLPRAASCLFWHLHIQLRSFICISFGRGDGGGEGSAAVRAHTLAGHRRSALIRRGIIGMISVRRAMRRVISLITGGGAARRLPPA